MNSIVKVNKIYPDAHIPTYGSAKAACADVYVGPRFTVVETDFINSEFNYL